jgi:hypothetical protein
LEAGEERGAMWIGKAFKLVVRPLSALSLVVPMFGMLGAVALAVLGACWGWVFMCFEGSFDG